jgi:hypothetical protein
MAGQKGEIIQVTEENIIIRIPRETVRISVIVKTLSETDDKPLKLSTVYDINAINKMRNNFIEHIGNDSFDGVEDDNFEINVIFKIPVNTIEMNAQFAILGEGCKLKNIKRKYKVSDIREFRKKFIDELIDDDYNATYVITDYGKKLLEQLNKLNTGDNDDIS